MDGRAAASKCAGIEAVVDESAERSLVEYAAPGISAESVPLHSAGFLDLFCQRPDKIEHFFRVSAGDFIE